MSDKNELVEGDTGSELEVTCKENDAAQTIIDLTGATVKLRFKILKDAVVVLGVTEQTMTIVGAPTNGIAKYVFLGVELPGQGNMHARAVITDSGGKIISQLEPFIIPVGPKL